MPTAIPYQGRNGAGLWECLPGCAMAPGPHEGRVCQRVPLILDTPERREYEAAKKAGKEVPPDLANISDAQRERMAEQRALIQAERLRKGLPPSASATAAPTPGEEDVSVRVEELPATGNGSVGAEEER